jgi:hypothetical protein
LPPRDRQVGQKEQGDEAMKIPTVSQLIADEALLRRVAGEVLNPGTRKHHYVKCPLDRKDIQVLHPPELPAGCQTEWRCLKCKHKVYLEALLDVTDCPVPDTAVGSMANIATQLRAKCWERKDHLQYEIVRYGNLHPVWGLDGASDWCWFALKAGSKVQAALCLAALGEAEGA